MSKDPDFLGLGGYNSSGSGAGYACYARFDCAKLLCQQELRYKPVVFAALQMTQAQKHQT